MLFFAESDEGGDDDEEEINVHDLEEHAANGGNFMNFMKFDSD